MFRVVETVRIHRNADALWLSIGRFGSVADWHPLLAKVDNDGDEVGSLRRAQSKTGERQVERLEAMDSFTHRYRYSILAGTLPVRDYHGEFRIDHDGNGTSTVVWSADFEVTSPQGNHIVDSIRSFFQAGLKNLEKLYQ